MSVFFFAVILVNHFIRGFRIAIELECRSRLPLLLLKLFQVFSTGVWVWMADIWSNLIGTLERRNCGHAYVRYLLVIIYLLIYWFIYLFTLHSYTLMGEITWEEREASVSHEHESLERLAIVSRRRGRMQIWGSNKSKPGYYDGREHC